MKSYDPITVLYYAWGCITAENSYLIKESLRSIRKGSSLCPNPFKGFTLWSESFEGLKGVWDLKCPSASSSRAHMEAPSSWKESAQRIMGGRSVHQLYPSKSFIPKGPLKRPVLCTSVWNDPSKWRPWLLSLWSALQRAIYPVWNALSVLNAMISLTTLAAQINWPFTGSLIDRQSDQSSRRICHFCLTYKPDRRIDLEVYRWTLTWKKLCILLSFHGWTRCFNVYFML